MHVVSFDYHMDQFITEDKGQYQPCYGYDHGFRQGLNQGKDTAVPERELSRVELIFSYEIAKSLV